LEFCGGCQRMFAASALRAHILTCSQNWSLYSLWYGFLIFFTLRVEHRWLVSWYVIKFDACTYLVLGSFGEPICFGTVTGHSSLKIMETIIYRTLKITKLRNKIFYTKNQTIGQRNIIWMIYYISTKHCKAR
jgi:hypothetical protein